MASSSRTEVGPDAGFLRSLDLFADLDASATERLAGSADTVHLAGGGVLMREGDPAECMYVLRVGRLRVTASLADGTDGLVGTVGRGEAVGEMALIGDERRSATVVAERDSELVRVPTAAFEELVAADPRVLRSITSQVVGRMREALHSPPVEPPCSTVTVLPITDDPATLRVAAELAEAIADRVVGSTTVGPDHAERDPRGRTALERGDGEAATRWLGDLERDHPLVVFRAAPAHERWTTWCARQSDRVLLVADLRSSPELRPVEAAVADRQRAVGAHVELVLVRPDWVEDARNTERWLSSRAVDGHHHVRQDHSGDLGRVARLTLGQGVTLVLSGGGARGIAHIGVVRALQELEVPIDAIGGTSIGSLVGAAVARGWGWERIRRAVRTGVAEGRGVIDPTVPVVSLASGRRMTRRLQDAADHLAVEDLLIDYFCVSTNLSRKVAQEHDRGPAWWAVRASLAIPGMFPPVPDGEDVLIDGGLLENFPVARMRRRRPGATIVGVDVGSRRDLLARGLSESCELSPWEVVTGVARRRFGREAITLTRVLARLTELGLEPDGAAPADVTVRPPVQDIPILAFSRFDELVELGYQEGLRVLRPWVEERHEGALS